MSRFGFARLAEEIHHQLGDILQFEAHDPRFAPVTVLNVKLSRDGRHARILFSILGDDPQAESEALETLATHKGFLRSVLAQRLRIRHTPELHFEVDETERRARRIEQLLEQNKPKP